MHWPSVRLRIFLGCYVIPVMIFTSIWLPLILHYYVPNIVITEEIVDRARRVPTDSVLNEIEKFFGSDSKTIDSEELITSSEMILQGQIAIPRRPSSAIGFPFDADDFDKKVPGWQLFFATFSVPDLLLGAYEVTGRDDFLIAAKDVIMGFASYERKAWLPKALLWNDHAIAARISVMAKFWKLYRNHPEYNFEAARDLFQMVTRSAQLLAKPAHFTFATNHGIMQNLALWQICIAFPTLPDIEFYKHLALERMRDQMLFYVNDEGVVLEHSAGYQKAGLKFMDMAFIYLRLLNMPIPKEWEVKYQKAKDFYAQLQRPDGSLPQFGDTGGGRRTPHAFQRNEDGNDQEGQGKAWCKSLNSKQPHSLYPVAGYSIWWDGLDECPNEKQIGQTVVAWSYFPGHAHKHADEMSVLLWSNGHNWWTNIGYWPYGIEGRSEAVSWNGSNAPHLINETARSIRHTRLVSYAWSDSSAAIDLERKGPDEYIARRQVIQVKPKLWIVIDHTFGNEDQRTTTTWTTSSHINLSKGELPGSYILEPESSNEKLIKFILTSGNAKISEYNGSFSPFAGWHNKRPAPAIRVEQPANDSWTAALWLLQETDSDSHKFNGLPFMENWKNSDNWKIVLPLSSNVIKIWRENDHVFVQEDARGTRIQKVTHLPESPQITGEIAEIHKAFEKAAKKYPWKRYIMNVHLKATYLILILFLVQELFFIVYLQVGEKYYAGLRLMNALGWIVTGIWIFGVYL